MNNKTTGKVIFLFVLISVLSLGTIFLKDTYVTNMKNRVDQVNSENQDMEGKLLFFKSKYSKLFDMEIFTSNEINNKIPNEFDYFDIFNNLVYVPTKIAEVKLNKYYIEEDNSFISTHKLPEELGAIKISVIISTDDFDSISVLLSELNDTERIVLIDSITYNDLSLGTDNNYNYNISITYYAFYEKETL